MLKMEIAFDKGKIEREGKYDIEKMWLIVDDYFKSCDIPITVVDDYTHVFQGKGKSDEYSKFAAAQIGFEQVDWFMPNLSAWKWFEDHEDEDYDDMIESIGEFNCKYGHLAYV